MDAKRAILYFILAILGAMLWHAWTHDYPPVNTPETQAIVSQNPEHPAEFTPSAYQANVSNTPATPEQLSKIIPAEKNISIKTDVLSVQINLIGGNLVDVKLLKYPVSLKEKNTPTQILNSNNDELYIAQSGLSVATASKEKSLPVVYQSAQSEYVLQNGQDTLTVTLSGKTPDGLALQKIYTFSRGQYTISSNIHLTNDTGKTWNGSIYNQMTRRNVPVPGRMGFRAYNGASVSTENTPYKKLSFDNLSESDFSRDITNGWLAMQQHYFLSVWIPPKNQSFHYYSRSFNDVFVLGYVSPTIQLLPGESTDFQSTFYVGPEIAKNLEKLGRGLDHTVDYGWLWPISEFLFWLLDEVHHFVGNWGWSIVLITVIIKIAFYWFSNKSYHSMAKMREFQPRIQALKDRHGDDKSAMSRAMMELYRKEKMNPLGGCLPMVIQIPVFIALYYVLIESVELRQAPFIFWIHDLSVRDPYFIFPILMGLSMLIQQKISPPPPDPMQAKMMMLLPLIFTVFFATFPAGLVLYWLTNNCASILHQWFAMRVYDQRKKATRAKR